MLTITRYHPSDHDEVWALYHMALASAGEQAGPDSSHEDLHHIEANYLRDGDFLVGREDARIIAMGACVRTGPDRGEIRRMHVHPDFQGRDYGRTMLEALEARALERGFCALSVDVAVHQIAAQGLYERMGYTITDRNAHGSLTVLTFTKQLASDRSDERPSLGDLIPY